MENMGVSNKAELRHLLTLFAGFQTVEADLDDGAPFLLSSLPQAIETFLSEAQPVDWTRFPHRKSLVRVLQYAQEVGLVLVYDGNSALFGSDHTQEVLYENTGLPYERTEEAREVAGEYQDTLNDLECSCQQLDYAACSMEQEQDTIQTDIDSTGSILEDRDRELFENILTETIQLILNHRKKHSTVNKNMERRC